MTDRWSGKKSIKLKLMTLLLAGNSLLLATFLVGSIYYETVSYRKERTTELASLGELLGRDLAASVASGDSRAAREILSKASAIQHIISAEVVNANGKALARYQKSGVDESFRGTTQEISQPVRKGGREVGTLRLVSLDNLHFTMTFLGALFLSALLAVAIFGIILSRRIKGLISDPIQQLTQKMEIVSRDQDYRVRVERVNDDELGLLSECFNEMLTEISVRDERLALHSEELKLEVDDRTKELSNVNRQLAESLDEVRRAMETAQAASKAKSDFLAQMSHEIRTPMYGVLGMTELLQSTDLTKEQSRFVETVRRSGEALLSIINNILDFSKIEAGRMELEIIPFDLHELVSDTVDLFAEDAAKKGIDLRCEIAAQLPRTFMGDPGRLRQVIVNLLGNALKFTHKGSVTLVAFMERPPDLVRISITDTGIGIAPEVQARIFKQFSQGDQSMTRKYGGTGLGLAIAKQLTELMGGEIRVASEPGKGSTFSFTVRLDSSAPQDWVRPEQSRVALRGKRVLVTTSDATTNELLVSQLTSWGVDVESAEDGPGAVCRVVAAPFDLAILDHQVGSTDGTDLGATIRSLPAGHMLRLVLLSKGRAEPSERTEEVGILPISRDELRPHRLYAALVKALGMEQLVPADELNAADPGKRPPHVLLVEDNPVNQEVGKGMLESLGCTVEIVANGLMAVEAVQNNRYDLVFMDYQMPVMDGLEAIRTIRAWESSREGEAVRVPIVSLTACAMSQDRLDCLEAGADDYLSKPFTRDDMSKMISRRLQQKGTETAAAAVAGGLPKPAPAPASTRRAAENAEAVRSAPAEASALSAAAAGSQAGAGGGREAAASSAIAAAAASARAAVVPPARTAAAVRAALSGMAPSVPPAAPPAAAASSFEDLSLESDRVVPGAIEMIRTLPGNRGKEILRKVVDLYLASTPTLLQTMREAESGGDAEKLKAAAHSFKSSSANLGAMRLAGVCKELERLGRQGSTEGALPLLVQVEEEYRVVRDALQGGHLC